MSRENVEIVRRAIDAFSSGDAASFAVLTTTDFEWKTGLGAVEGEVFRGHEGVHTYFGRLGSAWEEFLFLAEEYRDHDDTVLVLGRLEGRGRGGRRPGRFTGGSRLGPARRSDLEAARLPRPRRGGAGGGAVKQGPPASQIAACEAQSR